MEQTQDTKHNGWTNYETWRVHLELLDGYIDSMGRETGEDGYSFDDIPALADHLKEAVENAFENAEADCGDSEVGKMLMGWATAFASEVNYFEIARNAADSYPQLIKANPES